VRLRDADGTQIVNYTSRILGRTGYMNAVLVSEPKQLAQDIELFKDSLKGFEYIRGQSYTEFKSGDKVAEYGLTALIVGGAAAAAAKGGLFKSLGKFLWLIAVGALAGIGALWKRFTGRRDD